MSSAEAMSNDSELDAVIAEYLQKQEAGEHPDQVHYISAYPHLAEGLHLFFQGSERLQPLAWNAATMVPAGGVAGGWQYSAGDEFDGRYRLIEVLGEGGMGTVWLAEQQRPVQRRVAIKLIRPGLDSRQVLARFEAERQALAMMDHPNIARVFDGGLTSQGRPYFVMEYLRGVPLLEYCDREQLTVPDRLQLFTAICRGVQHAHLKGVVHRDLKPSNLLVCEYDGAVVPKVIDFGLARALHQPLTERTLHTAHGALVGTPMYMSPEQSQFNNLDVDTRTDVYSLGVVLYELLTGHTPLEREALQNAAFLEMLRLIREQEVLAPSTRLSTSEQLATAALRRRTEPRLLCRSLSGELDWIVLKSLEKQRDRRYQTTQALAGDIERFLADEPVEAAPPSKLRWLRRVVRRHRGRFIAASVLLLAVFAGLTGLMQGWLQSRESAARLSALVQKTRTEYELRERALQSAREQERLAEETLSDGIYLVLGDPDAARSEPLAGLSAAECRALERWAAVADDEMSVRVLADGLRDADRAVRVASRMSHVLRICPGLSDVRREQVLKMLAERQRCVACPPEVRAVSCLLMLTIGGAELPALRECITVLGEGSILHRFLEKQIYRRLSDIPEESLQECCRALVGATALLRERSGLSGDIFEQLIPYELGERRGGPYGVQSAADMWTEAEPEVLDRLSEGRVRQIWDAVIAESRETGNSAVLQPAVQAAHRKVPVLMFALLRRLSAEDFFDLLPDVMAAGVADRLVPWAAPAESFASLLRSRLGPAEIRALAGRLRVYLEDNTNRGLLTALEAAEQSIRPLLSVEIQNQLDAVPYSTDPDWEKRWVSLRSRRLQEQFSIIEQHDAWQIPVSQSTNAESLSPAGPVATPWQRLDAAKELLGRLEFSLPESLSLTAGGSGVVPFAVAGCVPHLDCADIVLTLPLLTCSPSLMTEAAARLAKPVIPLLPRWQQARMRNMLLSGLKHTPLTRYPQKWEDTDANWFSRNLTGTAELLGALAIAGNGAFDSQLLAELVQLPKEPDKFAGMAFALEPSLRILSSRADGPVILRAWQALLSTICGLRSLQSEGPVRSADLTLSEVNSWHRDRVRMSRITTVDTQMASLLLRSVGQHLEGPHAVLAWQDAIQRTTGNPETGSLDLPQQQLLATILCQSMTVLAGRLPAAEAPRFLRDLALFYSVYQRDGHTGGLRACEDAALPLLQLLKESDELELATWLVEPVNGVDPVVCSVALRPLLWRMGAEPAAKIWDGMWRRQMMSLSVAMQSDRSRSSLLEGFSALSRCLTEEQCQERWDLVIEKLRQSGDSQEDAVLTGVLWCLSDRVPGPGPGAAVPLLVRCVMRSMETPVQAEAGVLRQTKSSGSRMVHDHVIGLAAHLDARSRRLLAAGCLDAMVRSPAVRDVWTPVGWPTIAEHLCDDPRQILEAAMHPLCSEWLSELLLRRFEELVLHDGRWVFFVSRPSNASRYFGAELRGPTSGSFSALPQARQQLEAAPYGPNAIKNPVKIAVADEQMTNIASESAGQDAWIEAARVPRRLRTSEDIRAWIQQNWPEFQH